MGLPDDFKLGEEVGFLVGIIVVATLGVEVGISDLVTLGEIVGDMIGLDVGFAVGRTLGLEDGFLVGTDADEKIAQKKATTYIVFLMKFEFNIFDQLLLVSIINDAIK